MSFVSVDRVMEKYSKRQRKRNVEEDAEVIISAVQTRQRTIRRLRDYAMAADYLHTNSGSETMSSSLVGIAGGLLTMTAGAATILTAGAAAPMLALAGTATSVGGAGLSIWSTVDNAKRDAYIKERIKEVLAKDEDAMQEFEDVLARLSVEDNVYNDRVKRGRELLISTQVFNCVSSVLGSAAAWDCLRLALPRVAAYTTGATTSTVAILTAVLPTVSAGLAGEVGIEVVDEAVRETVSSLKEGATKKFVKKSAAVAAKEAYKEAMKVASKEITEELAERGLKEAAKKTAKEVAKKAAREAYKKAMKVASKEISEEFAENALKEATKKIAKQAANKAFKEAYKPALKAATKEVTEEAVQKAAGEAAKKAAEASTKQALKTAGKITGGITVGLGAVGALWDGYNLYKGYEKKNSSSELGRELRKMANYFEKHLQKMQTINPNDD